MKNNPVFTLCNSRILITGIVLLLLCTFSFAQSNPNLGDVDESGSIDIIDALQVARYFVGMLPSLPAIENADVNADGQIDIIDALLIAQYYVGIIDSFPGNPTPEPTPDATATPTTPPGGIPDPSREVPYNEDFTMKYGEVLKITGFEFIFRFSDVNDSRCPEDVVCVWEGEAVVTIDCWTDTQYIGVIEIKAPPAESQYDAVRDPLRGYYYQLTCKAVDPYPRSIVTTPKEDYVVTLQCNIAVP